MKTQFIFLLFGAALVCGCGRDYYNIATKTSPAKDYVIYKVYDSSFVAVPYEYRNELTLEVISEYSKNFSFDSLTQFTKVPSPNGAIELGVGGGIVIGGIIGYAIPPLQKGSFIVSESTFRTLDALLFAGIGIISGGIVGYLLRPDEEDMLPKIRAQKK